MSDHALPFGTAMALAERTLSAPLAVILEDEGLQPTDWFTLHALALRGGSLPTDAATTLLATNGLDAGDVEALVDRLSDAGLVARTGAILALTTAGTDRYEAVRGRVDAVTARIFAPFDPALVEQTRAFLQELAELDAEHLRALATTRG